MKYVPQNHGFTLIEALIAVTIVTLSVAGPLYTASRALVAAEIARDKLTASYLAQEGVEYIRMMRDSAYLSAPATGWSDFTTAIETYCFGPSSSCTIDPSNPLVGYGPGKSIVNYVGNAPLYLANCTNGAGGLSCAPPNYYTQQSGLPVSSKTPFTRTVQAFHTSGNEERIDSAVTWSFHGTPYTVTVSDHVTPWQ